MLLEVIGCTLHRPVIQHLIGPEKHLWMSIKPNKIAYSHQYYNSTPPGQIMVTDAQQSSKRKKHGQIFWYLVSVREIFEHDFKRSWRSQSASSFDFFQGIGGQFSHLVGTSLLLQNCPFVESFVSLCWVFCAIFWVICPLLSLLSLSWVFCVSLLRLLSCISKFSNSCLLNWVKATTTKDNLQKYPF